MEKSPNKRFLRNVLISFGFLFIALLIYATVLSIRLPRQIGLAFRYEITTVGIVSGIILYLVFSLKGWPGHLCGLSITLVLFALPLSGLWASGASQLYISGLLPYSDANGYYLQALTYLEGGSQFSYYASSRPLFINFLALLILISGYNLQITLAIMVGLTAVASYLLAREIQPISGSLGAAIVLLLCFFVYRRWSGTTMSENLGFLLGVMSLALLLRGAFHKSLLYVTAGMFIITLGLNARPGTYFVLPMLLLWCGWYFSKGNRYNFKATIVALLAVVVGLSTNLMFQKNFGYSQGSFFISGPAALFGTIQGGSHMSSLYTEHPEILTRELDESVNVYSILLKEIIQNPGLFLSGITKAYTLLFSFDYQGLFGFIDGEQLSYGRPSASIAMGIVYVMLVLGIIKAISSGKSWQSLLLFGGIGFLLSIPFVPPWNGYRGRMYITTISIFFVLVGIGIHFLVKLTHLERFNPARDLVKKGTSEALGIFLCVFLMVSPIVIGITSQQQSVYREIACANDETALYFRFPPGTFVTILPNDAIQSSWLPLLRQSDYVKGVHGLSTTISLILDKINPTRTITTTLELKSMQPIWVDMDPGLIPANPQILGACGRLEEKLMPLGFVWYHLSDVREVHY